MGRLTAFISVSLDGCFADAKGDMQWAHAGNDDAEYQAFVQGNASGDGMLLFGRTTYDLMIRYWPTPMAVQQNPIVAKRMNDGAKVVFSRTMSAASWNNTKLVNGDLAGEVRKLKQGSQPMTILGSGSIVSQLTDAGLIDDYVVVVVPIVLGSGKRIFEGVEPRRPLTLTKTRSFKNGKVVLSYEAVH
jgi:dihydrofolate reductase